MSGLISLIVTLVIVVVMLVFSVVVTVVAIAAPIALWWFVLRNIGTVSIPVVPDGPPLVMRTTCRACGAPKVARSLSAYVYCDYCGELTDWDFQAALADKRSKLPGPTYEALLRSLGPKLAAAKSQGDKKAYEAHQREIYGTFAKVCPAALSPRIGDARYREKWLSYTARHQTAVDFDPKAKAAFDTMQAATQALQWDRSNPFQPRATAATFWPLVDAVLAYQQASTDVSTETGLIETHPDHPTGALLLRIGASAFAQGWIPFLAKPDQDAMIAKLDLGAQYERVEPPAGKEGACPGCGAKLTVVDGAHRVLCHACGHLAGVDAATLPCHGCGTPVTLPAGTSLFKCPSCDAELRMMRWS